MAFYNEKEQLYIERDVSGVGLVASLLQVRDGILFQKSKTTDDTALQLIAFASKSLTSAKM